ncbi:hypothetical protein [Kibdelosporangium phytohabitans]|uniref:Secreted protein n=1 Tax=Kibdelosporangium phytohabitans TaxID=860235 RepID=A0A0N9HKM0_9PSEU|nr:hypothetical protein [Kibdelosporangium phytohabitans]ALG06577.1 hypothetical protein AOZ06_06230 [Kibdelosporangium phytohabitans]MBE1467768.1 hypothetical protein [Kibdelosporangium phytohabitans]
MARATRAAGMVPLVGALAAAAALAGVAVFSASSAGCASPGQYVQRDGYVELVGGCIDSRDLPPAPLGPPQHEGEPAGYQQ